MEYLSLEAANIYKRVHAGEKISKTDAKRLVYFLTLIIDFAGEMGHKQIKKSYVRERDQIKRLYGA